MTNTICILNDLIDDMMPDNYLFAIVSDSNELQFIRLLGSSTSPLGHYLQNQSVVDWDVLGIDYSQLQDAHHAAFYHGDLHWQINWVAIDHLNEGHYWLALFCPADFPTTLCASLLTLVQTMLTERVESGNIKTQMDSAHQFTFAIMNSLKFGVVAVNKEHVILYANDFACVSVNIRRRELLKIPITQFIDGWETLEGIVETGGNIQDEEVFVNCSSGKVKYNLAVSPINDASNELIGMVISLRELGNVYQIVNKYTGMKARFSFDDIVGKSKEMRKLIDYAKAISNSPSTVLIEGESGTGKEVFAQSIHNASSRREAGFVAINCAAIPENLIESELFGYDDGAFTGAIKGGKPGKFELANGGTLFLDEIGDMKPDMQAKLLRAIQESAITRVGGNKVVPVDVRIIAATNKNLKKEVEANRFRLDLFYRLSVIPLKIPPLRERKSDLPSLIRIFLQKKSLRLGKKIPTIHFNEFQKLLDYDWPGNIRELENFVEQLVNLDGNFSLGYFQQQFNQPVKQPAVPAPDSVINFDAFTPITLDLMEQQVINQTLIHCNGNMSLAAKTLGISRNTLYLKLKKLGNSAPVLS